MYKPGDKVRIKSPTSNYNGEIGTVENVLNSLHVYVEGYPYVMSFLFSEVEPVDTPAPRGYVRPSAREGDRLEDKVAVVFEELLDDIDAGRFRRGDYTEYGLVYKVLTIIHESGVTFKE